VNKRLTFALIYGVLLGSTLLFLFHAGGTGRILCRTFLGSEWLIGSWMTLGYPGWLATLIATTIGNFADCHWWAFIFFGMKELKHFLERYPVVQRRIPWLWHQKPTDMEFKSWRYQWGYRAIPLLCCIPSGGVWGTFMMAEFLDFVPLKTLYLALVGNTIKGICYGIAFAFAMNVPEFRQHLQYLSYILPFVMPIIFWLCKRARRLSDIITLGASFEPEE
jgi:hypothetical protein